MKKILPCALFGLIVAMPAFAARHQNSHGVLRQWNADILYLDGKVSLQEALRSNRPNAVERGFVEAYLLSLDEQWPEVEQRCAAILQALKGSQDFPASDVRALRAQALLKLSRSAEADFPQEWEQSASFWQPVADELTFAKLLRQKNIVAARKWLKARKSSGPYAERQLQEWRLLLAKATADQKLAFQLQDYLRQSQNIKDLDGRFMFLQQHFPRQESFYRKRYLEPLYRLELAHQFYDTQHWDDAEHLLRGLESEELSPGLRAEQYWLWGTTLSRLHHYQEGVDLLEKARAMPQSAPFLDAILSRLSITYAKLNMPEKVYALREHFLLQARKNHNKRELVENLLSLGTYQLDQAAYANARKSFSEVILLDPRSQAALRAQWFTFWAWYQEGKYAQAIAEAEKFSGKKIDTFLRAQVEYWRARSLEKSGKKKLAHELYRKLVQKQESVYYAHLAEARLAGKSADELVQSEVLAAHQRYSPPQLREFKTQNAQFQRWQRLAELGFFSELRRELELLSLEQRVVSAEQVAFAWSLGAGKAACRWNAVLPAEELMQNVDLPGKVHCALAPFEPVVRSIRKKGELHSQLVSALMKAESGFNEKIVSPAGAIGLMQLMPSTARKVHGEVFPQFSFAAERLFDPAANVVYGVRYLEKLERIFPHEPASWIASYNAGEEAVERWKEKRGNLPLDEFIESIPYKETNFYVKKVLANFWNLQAAKLQ